MPKNNLMPKLPSPVQRTTSTGLTREERQGVWPSAYVWNGYQYVLQQPTYSSYQPTYGYQHSTTYGYPQQTYGYQTNYGYQSWQRPQQQTWQQPQQQTWQQTWQQPQQQTWQQTWQQPQQQTWQQQQTNYGGQSSNLYGRRYSPKQKPARPLKQANASDLPQYASDLGMGEEGIQGEDPMDRNCFVQNGICRPVGKTYPMTPDQLRQMYDSDCDWSNRYVYEAQDESCKTNCDCDGLRFCKAPSDGVMHGTCKGQAE